jgi:hypothetical protein
MISPLVPVKVSLFSLTRAHSPAFASELLLQLPPAITMVKVLTNVDSEGARRGKGGARKGCKS